MKSAWFLALALHASACDQDDVSGDAPSNGGGGAAGGGGSGGAPPDERKGCPPGTRPLESGDCQAAGVPAEQCGEGFVADGEGGCEAILPDAPCEDGMMALPGNEGCRPVAECGQGPWGNIPVDATTEYVDGAYPGGDSDGSEQRPWTTIGEGMLAAQPGSIVAVAAGSYAEIVSFRHQVKLWGRCPSMVEIVGDVVAVVLGLEGALGAADGSELHNLAITGPGNGVVISAVEGFVMDRVWLHDLGDSGLVMADAWGGAVTGIASNSLFERVGSIGAAMLSGDFVFDGVVIRYGGPGPSGEGRGVALEHLDAAPLRAAIRNSVIENNRELGVHLVGGELDVERSLIRRTEPLESGRLGRGLEVSNRGDGLAFLTVSQSIVSENADVAVLLTGAEADLSHVTIRDTRPNADGSDGRPLVIQWNLNTETSSKGMVRESSIAQGYGAGVAVVSAEASLESVSVRDIRSLVSDGRQGMGIIASFDAAFEVGVAPPSELTLQWSQVTDTHVAGVALVGGRATVEATSVGRVMPTADGSFGDGLLVMGGPASASMAVVRSEIVDNQRAGIASFGAEVSIESSDVGCNAIDLNGESLGVPFSFEDLGDNRCGCPVATEVCRVQTADLQPPDVQ